VVTLNEQVFMLDCGEGTQMQLAKYKIRRSRINHVFISHLHGDHYFGLPGLITSLGLLGREADLHIYAPIPLEELIRPMLFVGNAWLPYQLVFHPLGEEGIILEDAKFTVESFKVIHRIECWGFLFREKKKPRKINKDTIKNFDIPPTFYERLKDGEDFITPAGRFIENSLVTIAASPGKSYAYCADTLFFEALADKIRNVSLMYHETTYLKNLEVKARERFHSTSAQAGEMAVLAGAARLLIGHFSSKYENLDPFLTETQEVFPNTQLALEGVTYLV
jgi:ribonuclease Z